MKTLSYLFALSLSLGLNSGISNAKGLEELANDKPEEPVKDVPALNSVPAKTPAAKPGDSAPVEAKSGDAKSVDATPAPMVQSATSKALSDKLYLATSFGWATASRSSGKWKGSGASDITVGYKTNLNLMPKTALWTTYRYAPIAVVGHLDGVSYRGVWEGHNLGALASYTLSEKLNLLGSLELAYVLVYLRPLDTIEAEKKAETNGVMANIGGGADWTLMEKLSAGPRLYVGVGGFTIVQVSGEVSYKF